MSFIIPFLVVLDVVLAFWLFRAMDLLVFKDQSTIREILFQKHGRVGKACGVALLVLAPVAWIAVIIWIVLIFASVGAVILWPGSKDEES